MEAAGARAPHPGTRHVKEILVTDHPLCVLDRLPRLPVDHWASLCVIDAGDGVRWRAADRHLAVDRWILVEPDTRRGAFLAARTRGRRDVVTLRRPLRDAADASAVLADVRSAGRAGPAGLVLENTRRGLSWLADVGEAALDAFDWIALRDRGDEVDPLPAPLRDAGFCRLGGAGFGGVLVLVRDAGTAALRAHARMLDAQLREQGALLREQVAARESLAADLARAEEARGAAQARAEALALECERLKTEAATTRRMADELAVHVDRADAKLALVAHLALGKS
jgi:hypothetical protein